MQEVKEEVVVSSKFRHGYREESKTLKIQLSTAAIRTLFVLIFASLFCLVSCAQTRSGVQIAIKAGGLLEGPASDRLGNVYFSDVPGQRILKLNVDGRLSIYRDGSNGAVGLLIDPQGRLIACERGGSAIPPRVTRTIIETGKIEVLADSFNGRPLTAPNDVTIDGRGRLYFTDMERAAVYRIDEPGKVVRVLASPDVGTPNGIQISPDDRILYLVESGRGPTDRREIRAYDLMPDGSVRNPRTFYNFFPGRSADGISIDVDGNLYASAGIGKLRGTSETLDTRTGVYVISPAGQLLNFIAIPEDLITNNAFGGPDMKTLYVTSGPTLYKIQTTASGLPR